MKKSFRKIAINTFLSITVFSSLVGVNATTITETTGNDEYDTIADNSIVIGITKFEPNEVVTSKKTIKAAGNFYRFKNSNAVDPTIYYYLGSWFELDENNNATVVEDQAKLNALSIYYVNNVEKKIEVPYSADLAEGYTLVFETNDSEKNDEVKHQDGKLIIPATLNKIKVIAKNDETNNEIVLDTLENVENEFVTSTTVVTTLAELKAAIANKDTDIRLGADIENIGEVLSIPYTVNLNGNNHKLTFSELAKDDVTKVASGLVISGDNSVVNDLTIEMTEKAGWQGNYALQVYDATGVVLKNYVGTKADAALLLNGAGVELTGTTVVTGNEYGGIEVSKGTNPALENSKLVVTGTITMTDEATKRPVIWVEKDQGTVEIANTYVTSTETNDKEQTYYYSDAKFITIDKVSNELELKNALLNKNIQKVVLLADFEVTEKLFVNHTLLLDGNNHKLTADGVTMFHVTGDSNDAKPTAVLTLDNIDIINTTETCVQVGSKGLLTDKETDLKVVVKENAYLETGEIGVLLYSKNSTVDLYGEIKITSNGAGIQGNGTNDEDENFGGTVVNIYETAKITTGATGIGLYIPQDGEVNIFGGEITSATPIALKSGKLNISGGTLTANGEYVTPIRNNNGADPTGDVIFVELNNGYVGGKINDNIVITITGGTLTSENGNIIRAATTTETAATYIVNAKDLLSAKVDNLVIYDYNQITAYADNLNGLKDALLDKNVSTVKLNSDFEITEKLFVNHTLLLDGNNHKLTADGVTMFHVTGDSNDAKPTAVLTLDNIDVINTTETCVQVGSKGLLTDKETDLKVVVKENAYLETGEIGVLLYSKNSTVDLYGEIKITSNGAGIQGNGTNDEDENFGGTVVNIYETAKITTGATGIGLYIPQDGEVNIFGGEITSATPIALKSGKLNISGGTLTANGEYVTPIRNNNGSDPTGDVIFVELNDSYIGGKTNNNIEINITGGTLTSQNGNVIRASRTTENTATYVVNCDNLTKVTEDNSDLYN